MKHLKFTLDVLLSSNCCATKGLKNFNLTNSSKNEKSISFLTQPMNIKASTSQDHLSAVLSWKGWRRIIDPFIFTVFEHAAFAAKSKELSSFPGTAKNSTD